MRKILIYEQLTATGETASPLCREGQAMLDAVAADLRAVPGIDITVWPPQRPAIELGPAARLVDGVLCIAPETGGTLERLCQAVEMAGGVLLGPSSAAVRLTADKLALAQHLTQKCVPTPPCQPAGLSDWPYPQVCKPRDGAGSQATFLVESPEDWPRCIEQARREGFDGELLAQRYVPGIAGSISFMIGTRAIAPLLPTRQVLSEDGRLKYLGSTASLPDSLCQRAVALGRRAADAVPGLRGYVGVDVVLGESPDDDWVIEINPRLTSSYLEVRRVCRVNLMGLMLDLLHGTCNSNPDRGLAAI